jgi:RND family efflux transporter MFP subunit
MMRRERIAARVALITLAVASIAGCSKTSAAGSDAKDSASASDSASTDSLAATPVQMAVVQRGNIAITVTGPGRTDALELQNIRAPFTGILTSVRYNVGDHVSSGQPVASIVNQPSQAALIGAEEMVRSASTAAQRSDAERALVLAKQNLVATQLRAPRAGVVVSRGATQGELVSQGDSILDIASANSIIFVARIAQADLTQIRPGQSVRLTLPGQLGPVPGIVHGLMPADSNGSMAVPVRVDLSRNIQTAGGPIQPGLFGTAEITIGQKFGVPIVPATAVLRDDITGISRVAVVSGKGRVHWLTVTTGATQGGNVEIVNPALAVGQRVIVSGLVGLPEGSKVRDGTPAVETSQ